MNRLAEQVFVYLNFAGRTQLIQAILLGILSGEFACFFSSWSAKWIFEVQEQSLLVYEVQGWHQCRDLCLAGPVE